MTKAYTIGMFCAAGTLALAGSAQGVVTATFTADNHYGLYGDYGGALTFIGANETGAYGSPGRYNWSLPETFTFDTPDTVYIAAWSDGRVAQGLIGQLNIDGVNVYTGDAGWEVFATGIELGAGASAPDVADMAAQIAIADSTGAWEIPFVGFDNVNTTRPWGKIAGISEEANWVWRDSGDLRNNPLIGGSNSGEYLIFRTTAIPTPGAVSVLALGGLASIRRRRTA